MQAVACIQACRGMQSLGRSLNGLRHAVRLRLQGPGFKTLTPSRGMDRRTGECTQVGAKVGGPVGAPQNVGGVAAQAQVQEHGHVLLIALPGLVHVPHRKARVPRPELCIETPSSGAC